MPLVQRAARLIWQLEKLVRDVIKYVRERTARAGRRDGGDAAGAAAGAGGVIDPETVSDGGTTWEASQLVPKPPAGPGPARGSYLRHRV